jgi:signal transduction histidine kinase
MAVPSAAGPSVYDRMFPYWDVYFAVVLGSVAVAMLLADEYSLPRRLGGTAAIAAIGALYALVGRDPELRDRKGTRPAAFITAQAVLFAVAVGCSTFCAYLLFALLPMILLTLPMAVAVWFVVAVNLVPVAAGLITDGFTGRVLVNTGSIAVVSITFAVWQGFWVTRVITQSAERADLIDELEASRAENARLSHEAGVAAERARLAGEIHDTLAQGFTSIITLLQAADPELRDERLALAVRTAKENLAESRALVAELAPSALAGDSLPDAVRRQASRFTEESAIPVTVRLTGEVRELPTATEVVLLRSTQEALTNVRRHSGAHEVAILLAYAETTVRLVVRDDGRGFDPAAVRGSAFGLRGMRLRAEQVAGALRVRGDPETGTTIELEVPA